MTQRKRIRFTRAELELINSMAAIASAAPWGEGDYYDWEEKHTDVFNSLRDKVWELAERAGAVEAAAAPKPDLVASVRRGALNTLTAVAGTKRKEAHRHG